MAHTIHRLERCVSHLYSRTVKFFLQLPVMNDRHLIEQQIAEVKESVIDALADSAAQVTPMFFENLPEDYFTSVDTETQLSHLKALIATKLSGFSQDILLKSKDGSLFTFIIENSYPGQLSELLHSLPHGQPLHTAKVFTAKDDSLILDIFHFGELPKFDQDDDDDRKKMEELLAFAKDKIARPEDIADFEIHLRLCSQQYLHTVRPERLLQHYRIVSTIRGTNDTVINIEHRFSDRTEITIGIGLPNRRAMFERISRYFGKMGVDIKRAHMESFRRGDGAAIVLLGFQVSCSRNRDGVDENVNWVSLEQELTRLFYLDEEVLEIAYSDCGLNLLEAELLVAFTHLGHQVLLKSDRFAYSREHIKKCLLKHLEITRDILARFMSRFDDFQTADVAAEEGLEQMLSQVNGAEARQIISAVARIPQASLATNLFFVNRYALCIRLEPSYLATADRDEQPFGLFFVCGRNFDGYHVRFQDIARGGVRIVRTANTEAYAYETERHYDEAYGLAFAQQLKNKDIPEGGAKGVVLTKPEADIEFCGRAFADALLDLIAPTASAGSFLVDYRKGQELLYLGPDENVSNDLITWIVERALQRGYPLPRSFMSSKPGAGINHKEYGVTSEGVVVYLETALREVGIDPRREKFSVKLTGGPDGDVAGNCIRILFREFPETVRITGIADGSGYAEDPSGLDGSELLRLVDEVLPVCSFTPEKLSASGVVREASDPESVSLRNNLHNRITTDAFIPAGGRPRTLNGENWQDFFIDKVPSSRVVVEGANLFITPEAREHLSACNVIIIRDSSANKCGVICSSFEIAASMLLSEEEFLELKQEFVSDIIAKLKELALLEARLLLIERRHNADITLPDLSKRISKVIERSARAIAGVAERLPSSTLQKLIGAYLPATLVQKVGEAGLLQLPEQYTIHLIAASIASKIVYREGLSYFESMHRRDVADYALRYLEKEAITATFVAEVLGSTLANKERIAHLLNHGATRIAMEE